VVDAAEQNGILTIRVKDQGPGIPPEDVDSIYDPFFTTKDTGTGLGLPVAYQIVQQHGGELMLEENGPGGACFAIRLPSESGAAA
jgi:signal transduction histidine kinase